MQTSPRKAPRTAARLALLAALAATAWVVAPALSAAPYLPVPRDFEQRLGTVERVAGTGLRAAPGASHRGEGPVTHRSAVLDAPARFDLAGLAGETRHYELRARERGGAWSPWTEVGSGDPVWFGGAEQLQVRARGWRPRGRVHYVNVSGDATPAQAALTAVRTGVASVTAAAVGLVGADPAGASPPKPALIGRARWGANRENGGCQPRKRPDYGQVRAAVVHHTVSANTYTRAEAPAMVLAICRFHRNGNGWNDIGYNALVDRFGNLYVGRAGGIGRAVVGAHSQGFNAQTTGLAALGTHGKESISRRAMAASADFLAWKLVRHGKTAAGKAKLVSAGGSASRYPKGERVRTKRIVGHRRLGLTECPGTALNRDLERLRRKTQRRIVAAGKTEPPPPDKGDGDGGIGRR